MMNEERPLGLTGIRRGGEIKTIPLMDFGMGEVMRREAESPEGKLKQATERIAELENALSRKEHEHAAAQAQAREEAYQKGLRDGTGAGEASCRAIAQAAMDVRLRETEASINHRLQAIECALESLFLDWEGRILELAMAISRRIVGEVCDVPGVAAAHVARLALKKLGAESRIRVRVHPEDFTALEREKGLWNARGNRTIELIEDETVGRGGVLVETEAGSIDARIPRMTQKVEEALAKAVAEESARLGS
jgi:flagellar biosynthesis/type III secretory pathway protein FliH